MTDTATSGQMLTNSDVEELTLWRRELHRHPEVSGEEAETARRVVEMLTPTGPDAILTELGGHGVAAIYGGRAEGPTVMLRCELDALPIDEVNPDLPHLSQISGKGHLCGHDGHMAILAATARWLGRNPPAKGRVVLLFQPAEEDGSGAARVIEDARFAAITPDYAFALHNFPGLPLGHAVIAAGPMNCASRGMKISFRGRTSHASQPDKGISPAPALASLLTDLTALARGQDSANPEFALVTVTHAHLGERAFGIAPGDAEIWVTLRTQQDAAMAALVTRAEHLVRQAAETHKLEHEISYHDIFHHCENDPQATEILQAALRAAGVPPTTAELPMRASEDFGRFRAGSRSAMFLLGAGVETPSLHNPNYDFPDDLIPMGAEVFAAALDELCY
ncbi:amidohydrolase [Pseudosulfitobacter koreensis]|uniref:Amidohydrolase n=1 Tax=Pseudosulfitobacter koreensis TaxID=2968472 RepID=A0ABT1Z449_9RHOB|nr:amidohydrolase [Pseudosulfitobacter koreense]MCR8827901.1 amidohydrolase [Pseudosulfitobacter koreense]